jgi:hypothetical protein
VTASDAGSEGTPSPAPYLARTPAKPLGVEDYTLKQALLPAGRDSVAILGELGLPHESVSALIKDGAVECIDVVKPKL